MILQRNSFYYLNLLDKHTSTLNIHAPDFSSSILRGMSALSLWRRLFTLQWLGSIRYGSITHQMELPELSVGMDMREIWMVRGSTCWDACLHNRSWFLWFYYSFTYDSDVWHRTVLVIIVATDFWWDFELISFWTYSKETGNSWDWKGGGVGWGEVGRNTFALFDFIWTLN